MKDQKNDLEILRHSLSHIMAVAVFEIWPDVKFAIGPAVENGFYYDFDFMRKDSSPFSKGGQGDLKISEEDLAKIEKKMSHIIKQNLKFEKSELKIDEAIKKEKKIKQDYKVELLKDLSKEGEKKVSYYKLGDFEDLCRGPHLESSGKIAKGSFKLTKLAGAYWRGNGKNKMLTRIYGVAFENKDKLEEYLKIMDEAEKRDHRKLGKELELFMISEDVGKGLPLWLPNGAFIRKKLEDYMYEKELKNGYKFVYTPVLTHKKLYEISGHLAHYRDDMYSPLDIEGEEYFLKPMNCPHHHIIYNHKPLSYRELPLRLADFGLIHRFERSGVLTGLIRARCFTQNDAHIYCRREDLKDELLGILKLFKEVYNDFNIKDFWFRLSLPDFSNKEKYGDIKNKKMWEEAADAAREAMENFGVKYVLGEGEATFYGPKIDVQIKNALEKEDTIATAQIDFYSAQKFNLFFTNEKGEKERPVIIHRAIMGSFDRFFAFLTEKTAGAFPLWLSPVQVKIISVGEKHIKYCQKLAGEFRENNIRVEVDDHDETVGNKIRKVVGEKIPYVLVVGDKEIELNKLAVRDRGAREARVIGKEEFIKEILIKVKTKK